MTTLSEKELKEIIFSHEEDMIKGKFHSFEEAYKDIIKRTEKKIKEKQIKKGRKKNEKRM